MLTIRDVIDEVKKVSNEYSIQGEIVPLDNLNNNDIFDYRINDFINLALSKIFKEYLSSAMKIFPVYPIPSLIDRKTIQHLNKDIFVNLDNETKTIAFAVSNEAIIEIYRISEENSTLIEKIDVYSSQVIKRKLPVLENCEKFKIVFSGKYPYLVENFGVYNIDFREEKDIPLNLKNYDIELPKDILRTNAIKFENEYGIENDFSDYIVSANHLLIPNIYKGNLKIVYYRLPEKIAINNTNINVSVDCPEAAEDCLVYYVASMCMKNYDNQLSILLYNEAELRLSETSKYTNNHNTTSEIADIRGW